MIKILTAALVCAIVPSALAASLWDGTWKLDRSKSHLTGDSFTYSKTPVGMWHVAFGDLGYDFAIDGKPYPVFDADHVQIATMKGDHEIDFVSQFKGKTTSTMKETLSTDGQTITDETTGTHVDGTSYTSSEVSKRNGPGTGFMGKWTSTKESSSSNGIFIISTAPDGTITMSYPISKESLTGKFDGTPLPVVGPETTPGVTVAYKTTSPRRLDYKVALKGKIISEGFDTLSNDGKTYSETSWAPGKIDEKTIAVYDKQ